MRAAREERNGSAARWWLLACLLAVCVACANSSSGDAVDGPLMRHPPPHHDDGLDAGIGGVLELDDGCLYVANARPAERHPLVWPAGTRWESETRTIVTPAGQILEIGDEVLGSGGYFTADMVERLAGADAAEVARRCVDNASGSIAVVNNNESAIARSTDGVDG